MNMSVEVLHDLLVGVDDLVEVLRRDPVSEPSRRHGHDAFGAELIGVCQVSTERLGIVRLVGDVG